MNQSKQTPQVLKDVSIFVIDDEEMLVWSIENQLTELGASLSHAGTIRQAIKKFPAANADVVICDLRLPDGNGLELLKKWRKEQPHLPIILITAHGAIDSAITALRLGAFDYLQKPFSMNDLVASVERAAEVSSLRQKVSRLQGRSSSEMEVNIIGSSPEMAILRERLKRIATSKADTAVVYGESGTGKELAARALHVWSDRASEPFVEINCASIPENLLESELFGYERGAFTDAKDRKLGLFEMARNGTIFLDEIGELPIKLQSKLLRALEYRRFKRLGGTKDIEFTARIVAATNRNLLEEVREQRFRGDLYYRLNVLAVEVPPLRERKQDILELAEFFLSQLSKDLEVKRPQLTPAAREKLLHHSWPGNVRELRNVLQRSLVFHSGDRLDFDRIEIDQAILPDPVTSEPCSSRDELKLVSNRVGASILEPHLSGEDEKFSFTLPEDGVNLEDLEKSLLEQALERAKNNQTRAAQLLNISRHTLRYRLEKHGLLQA